MHIVTFHVTYLNSYWIEHWNSYGNKWFSGYTRKYRQILTISNASLSVRKNKILFILNVFPVCLENVPFMSYDCDYCNMQYSQEHYFSRHFTGWHNPKRLDMLAILAGWRGYLCAFMLDWFWIESVPLLGFFRSSLWSRRIEDLELKTVEAGSFWVGLAWMCVGGPSAWLEWLAIFLLVLLKFPEN